MKNVRIKAVGAVLAVCGIVVLIAYLTNESKPVSLPLTADQQTIAKRLQKTVRGDIVYDANTGMAWRVAAHRGTDFLIIEHIMDGDTAVRVARVEEVARWADVVTNGRRKDSEYCILAERYLNSE